MKITPVLYLEAIEPILPLWIDRLGFTKTVDVPDGDRLGFAILVKDGAELMLQTQSSLEKDMPALAALVVPPSAMLFIEVDDFDDTLRRLNGAEVVEPVRTTFYGMKEIVVREPGGHVICFAAKV